VQNADVNRYTYGTVLLSLVTTIMGLWFIVYVIFDDTLHPALKAFFVIAMLIIVFFHWLITSAMFEIREMSKYAKYLHERG